MFALWATAYLVVLVRVTRARRALDGARRATVAAPSDDDESAVDEPATTESDEESLAHTPTHTPPMTVSEAPGDASDDEWWLDCNAPCPNCQAESELRGLSSDGRYMYFCSAEGCDVQQWHAWTPG